MDDATLHAVEHRLTRLERANRRWKVAVALAVGALGGVVALGAAEPDLIPDELRVKRLVIVDQNNKPRAVLGPSSYGSSGLRLYDERQKELVALEALPGSVPSMTFFAPDGKPAVWLISWPDVTTGLAFGDKEGKTVGLIMERDNMRLTFSDETGLSRTALGMVSDGQPGLALTDRDGTLRAELAIIDDEDPQLFFADKYGSDRAVLGLDKGRPVLDFLDETGKTIWKAP